jgi:hypothetical protein
MNPLSLRSDLETKNDLEWFDALCDLLTKEKHPTTFELMQILGSEDLNVSKEARGSKFLIPFDSRFKWAAINPDLAVNDPDKPLEYLAVAGANFNLKMADIASRFPNYRTQRNTYDGGTQIFFYPVPSKYEFSAIDYWIKKEPEEVENIEDLIFHGVAFKFGENLILGRDGFNLKR